MGSTPVTSSMIATASKVILITIIYDMSVSTIKRRFHILISDDFLCVFSFQMTESWAWLTQSFSARINMDYGLISPLVNMGRRLQCTICTYFITFRSQFSKTCNMANRQKVHTNLNKLDYKTSKISISLYQAILRTYHYQ